VVSEGQVWQNQVWHNQVWQNKILRRAAHQLCNALPHDSPGGINSSD
jgi:hypothetical protein